MITRRYAMAQSLAIIGANCCAGAEEEVPDLPPDTDTSEWMPFEKLRVSANRKFNKGLAVIQADFRGRWAKIIELATKIEVLLLAEKAVPPETEPSDATFPIRPYNIRVPILKTLTLQDKDFAEARAALTSILSERNDFSGGAWCHEPSHAIRAYVGVDCVFQSSLCWKCANYYVVYPNDGEGSGTWVGIPKKSRLEALLMRVLPPSPKADTPPPTKDGSKSGK